MNKEQINKMVDSMFKSFVPRDDFKGMIAEWFELNPQEPIVAGLSDEQIISFGRFVILVWVIYQIYIGNGLKPKPSHNPQLADLVTRRSGKW